MKGRSGRKPKSMAAHLLANTYRADRHGPLPAGGRAAVLRGPGAGTAGSAALSVPATIEPPADVLAGLGAVGTALVWGHYQEYELSAPEALILRTGAQALDRVAEVRAIIARDGAMLTTARGGQVAHPLLRVEHAAVQRFLQAMRTLGLPAPERT